VSRYDDIICIDCDGVLRDPITNGEIPFARESMSLLHRHGWRLICLTANDVALVNTWLRHNRLRKYFTAVTNVKPLAFRYIDDRAIGFYDWDQEDLFDLTRVLRP
jgi:hypothetical protein